MFLIFGGSAYLFAIIKYFHFVFLLFTPFATQFFYTPVTSSNIRYFRSSAFYRQPL